MEIFKQDGLNRVNFYNFILQYPKHILLSKYAEPLPLLYFSTFAFAVIKIVHFCVVKTR